MDPAKKIGKSLSTKIQNLLTKLGLKDRTLKLILLGGLVLFGASLFLFKFELLSYLSIDENNRLNSLSSLRAFLNNPTDPIQGALQWLSLKALPSHQIFALRAPSALLLGLTLALSAITLYLKFRNRYIPYIFALLAATSPWMILLSHQGYMPGIDLLLLAISALCSYFVITKSDLPNKYKTLALFGGAASIGLIALQPLGPLYYILLIYIARRSEMLKEFIAQKSKTQKLLLLLTVTILPLINVLFLYINIESWKIISGFSLINDPVNIPKALLYNIRSIFGIEQSTGLSLGTGRPDFLLMGALALTIYEIFKQRVGRKGLVIGLSLALFISALYGAPTSIVLAIPFTIAILSLALANMIRIIDAAFPRNPYPRNIARTGMLLLVGTLATLNIYTFISATVRENTPNNINIVTSNRNN